MFEHELTSIQCYLDELNRRNGFGTKHEDKRRSYSAYEATVIIDRLLSEEELLPCYISDRMPLSAQEIIERRIDELSIARVDGDEASTVMQSLIDTDRAIIDILQGDFDFDDEVYGCQDVFTGRYFKSNVLRIKQALAKTNQTLADQGSVSLNAYYANLGLPLIKIGYNFDWEYPECREIKLDISTGESENGMRCVYVDFQTYPKQNYEVWG